MRDFFFPLRQCCVHVLGTWILGVRLADSSGFERSGDCFRFDLCQLPPLPLFFGTVTLLTCVNEGCTFTQLVYHGSVFCWQGPFCLGNFPGEPENFHICPGCLVAQLELLGSVTWTDLGKSQAFLRCACLWFQPTGCRFPSGGLHL